MADGVAVGVFIMKKRHELKSNTILYWEATLLILRLQSLIIVTLRNVWHSRFLWFMFWLNVLRACLTRRSLCNNGLKVLHMRKYSSWTYLLSYTYDNTIIVAQGESLSSHGTNFVLQRFRHGNTFFLKIYVTINSFSITLIIIIMLEKRQKKRERQREREEEGERERQYWKVVSFS